MYFRCGLLVLLSLLTLTPFVLLPAGAEQERDSVDLLWKKTQVDKVFRSEGVAIADVNKDGKMDILAGDVWYEAPHWKMHPIRKVGNYGDGSNSYSKSFGCFTGDFNHDGWPDLIVIPFPGEPCYWYENPKGQAVEWKEHLLWHSACNETPQYADLFGTGHPVLIMGWQPKGKEHEGQMAWFQPGKDPTQPWEMHPISEPSAKDKEIPGTFRFAHGLGVGDVNNDGRSDVICTAGWWEQPVKDEGKPWKFHPADLSQPCADMIPYDVDGDGHADIISSSAHGYGIWCYQQRPVKDGDPAFVRRDLFKDIFSQTHALVCVDINGDGRKDLVTGKRWWAHGPKGDANPNDPAVLYWFEAWRGKSGLVKFIPHEIDNDSGIGTQFTVADINGDKIPDIIIANKKGVFVFEQFRLKTK